MSAILPFDDGSGPQLATAYVLSSTPYISRWDGATWRDETCTGFVNSLVTFDGGTGIRLYAGGSFTKIGSLSIPYLAQWDGQHWSAVGVGGSSVNSMFHVCTDFDDSIYLAGTFGQGLTVWDGAELRPAVSGFGMDAPVNLLRVLNEQEGAALYALGSFKTAGPRRSQGLGRWDGWWSDLKRGISDGEVRDVVVYDDGSGGGPATYVAGSFTQIGGIAANHIAMWDGSRWWPLGTGTNLPISCLAVFDDGGGAALYAASDFFVAGGLPANHIARWDGQRWEALGVLGGGVVDGAVNAMAVYDDGSGPALYVGGAFDYVDDMPIAALAKWDGWQWQTVGEALTYFGGASGEVTGLDVLDDGSGPALYVRGNFNRAGSAEAYGIARWTYYGWDPLGGGLKSGGKVHAWAVYDDGNGPALYAAGDFTRIGTNVQARRIAKWDGVSWSSLGNYGLDGAAKALTIFDDGSGPALYVGGDFTVAGGLVARRIARWNGHNWSVLGIGLNSGADYTGDATVNALAAFDDGSGPALYVAGDFDTADGIPSMHIARWAPAPLPKITRQPEDVSVEVDKPFSLRVTATGAEPLAYRWYKDDAALSDGPGLSGSTTHKLTVGAADTSYAGDYYVVVSNACQTVTSQSVSVQVLTDDDHDGVPQIHDACPNTIPDAVVDSTGCPPVIPGDFDRDGDVDPADFDVFASCASGSAIPSAAGCEAEDLDHDGDVDQADFGILQRCTSGTDVPATVGC